jgi:hypothetical protein
MIVRDKHSSLLDPFVIIGKNTRGGGSETTIFFRHFLSPGAIGGIQTLDLRIMSPVFYHSATRAQCYITFTVIIHKCL